MSKACKMLPKNVSFEISLLAVPESPSEFWVVCREDLEQHKILLKDIQNHCRTHLVGSNQTCIAKTGDVCIVKDENNLWLRVRVEYTDGIDMYVRDVDTGTLMTLHLPHNLYTLPLKFHKKFMGIKCRLNGVVPRSDHLTWPPWAIQVFRDNFKPKTMKVMNVQSNIHVVEVVLPDGKDLAMLLIEAEVAQHPPGFERSGVSEFAAFGYPCNKRVLSTEDIIVVTSIKNIFDFYAMKVDETDKQKFRQLMKDLKNHCITSNTIESIQTDLPVACMLSSLWSRAIVSHIDGSQVEVFFVDFGKKMFVDRADIRPIPDQLISGLPVQSFHCSLNLQDPVHSGTLEGWFKTNCSDSTFVVEYALKKDGKHIVDIKTKCEEKTVCQQLLQMGNKKSSPKQQPLVVVKRSLHVESQGLKDGCLAVVVHIISLCDFYVQKIDKDTEHLFSSLNECLNEDVLFRCTNIEPGTLVAAKYEGMWYRAMVNELLDEDLRVLFVDFGNEDIISKKSVRHSKNPVFGSIPFLANQCSLNSWSGRLSNQFVDKFKDLCLEKTFLLKNVRQAAPGLYSVDLIDPESWELVIDRTLLSKEIPVIVESGGHKTACENPQGTISCSRSLLSPGSLVSIKYSKSPLEFYISEESTELANLSKILSELGEAPVCNPHVGDIITSFYDDIWCRAKILKLLPNRMLRVKFIDFGNIADVSLEESKSISQELKVAKPEHAIHCWLAFDQNKSVAACWNDREHLMFRNYFEYKPYQLTSIAECGVDEAECGTIYEVELITPEGLSMADELVDKDEPMVIRRDLGTLIEENSYRCGLLFSSSPSHFWCQVLDPLIEFAEGKLPSFPTNGEYKPKLGEICLSFHEMRGEWYRAEVARADCSIVSLKLIDYEEDLDVALTHIHQLPLEMKRFPPLAFKCTLFGATPVDSEWSKSASDHFLSLLADQILNVVIVKRKDSVHWVKVTGTDGTSVLDKLRALKLAK